MWAVLGELCPHHHQQPWPHQLQEAEFPRMWQEQGVTKLCVRLSEDELACGEGAAGAEQEQPSQQHFFSHLKTSH